MTAQQTLDAAARGVRGRLRAALAASLAGTLALCAQAALLAGALAAAVLQATPWQHLLWPVAGYLGLALLRFVLAVTSRRAGFEAGRAVVVATRQRLLGHVRALGPAWLARQSSGELVTRLVDGVDALAPYYARYLPQKAAAALLPLVVLAAVAPADWVAALVLLVSAPLVPLFMVLLGDAAERASQRRWVTLTRLGTQFFDALQGLVTLRLFGAGRRRRERLAEASEAYRRETMAVLRVAFLSSLVLEFFATVSIAVVAVLIGFRLLWGDIAFDHGMFALLLAPEFFLPLRGLGALRHARMDALSVAADMDALLAQKAEQPPTAAGQRRSPSAPAIRFQKVVFAHEPGRPALDGADFELAAGSSTVVVGPSGAGKSTLLTLLMRFATPQDGRILVDGVELSLLDAAAWRAQIAWVPQRPHLFVGSLRDNLRLAAPHADDAALQRAAREAGLEAVVAALPQGWDTPLGDHGYGLSGGQAQRVALARAWLRDAPLLLLDEPTQHLDADTAAAVSGALARLRRGRTVIRVAHRLAAAHDADQVLVLRAGRVVESGPPQALAGGAGLFAELVQAEAGA